MPDSPVQVILGCWADLFELSQFRPKRRRFVGPGTWESVRSHGTEWGWPVDSLIVGPAAYAKVYRHRGDGAQAVAWFLPGENVANLLEHVPDEADSLRLLDRAPEPDEPTFEAYTRALARRRAAAPRRSNRR